MLLIDPASGRWAHQRIEHLPQLLGPGDVVVVNDAATLPASLRTTVDGMELELRLLSWAGAGDWFAVAFGAGDWRQPTEDRPPPPTPRLGQPLRIAGMEAQVVALSELSPRLWKISFLADESETLGALYAHGRPVQYSYLEADLAIGQVQTPYASRPWAVEMPSAGRPLQSRVIRGLRDAGARVVALTHAAGLSSTGDPALDAALPMPERYEIRPEVAAAVNAARRVIAVGTSVVRALEDSAMRHGRVLAGSAVAELVLDDDHRPRVVDALFSGMHEPGESHFRLFRAFADASLLLKANTEAREAGYLAHEFGDNTLILPGAVPAQPCANSPSETAARAG